MRERFRWYEVSADVAVVEPTDENCEIDAYTAPALRDVILDSINSGHHRLVMDMRRVYYLESPGLGVLVGGLKRTRAREGTVVLVGVRESTLKIFRITGLIRVFHISESIADAVLLLSADPLVPYPKKRAMGEEGAASHWFPARVYTSEENAGPTVDKSLRDLLDAAGIETVFSFPPEQGSWFRESILRMKDSTARPTRDEVLTELARSIELLADGKAAEQIDTTENQAVTDFLVALDKTPDAVVQVYSLLVIKVRDRIVAKQLNPRELGYWERHPGLARNPGRALRLFRRAGGDPRTDAVTAAGREVERFLECRAPRNVHVGREFEITARIAELRKPGGVGFLMPEITKAGSPLYVLLDVPPGCRVVSDPVVTINVPAGGDSDEACFVVRAPRNTGQHRLTVRVCGPGVHGFELARAEVVTTVSRTPTDSPTVMSRQLRSGAPGSAEANLIVFRSGPARYNYVLHWTGHSPVIDTLKTNGDPKPRLRQLIAELSEMSAGGAGWRPGGLRDELRARGGDLWRDFLPDKIREALTELSPGNHKLIVSCENPELGVPWELMYPIERIGGHSDFLVELFDVVRAPYGNAAWCDAFSLDPALVVLPDIRLSGAAAEAWGVRAALGLVTHEPGFVREKAKLQAELRETPFGLLHVTAHHRDRTGMIAMAARQKFSPADLNEFAGDGGAWSGRRPLVFVNACGTAKSHRRFTQFTSWAQAFFEAGAGGFVGSMWDVRSDTASEFARRFYQALYSDGRSFSDALRDARDHSRAQSTDPTWLAYSAHCDPAATVLADAT